MVKNYKKGSAVRLSANFTSAEFDCHGAGCCDCTKIDTALVERLQRIRNHFGRATVINSGYRCAAHNKAVGGASASRHLKGQAADIAVSGVAPAEVAKYAEHIGIKGIGLYSNFVHVDTRTLKSFWRTALETPAGTFGGTNPYKKPTANIGSGSRGAGVKWLQWELAFFGYDCGSVDGIFGVRTRAALRRFQSDKGLAVDGICGPLTKNKLGEV